MHVCVLTLLQNVTRNFTQQESFSICIVGNCLYAGEPKRIIEAFWSIKQEVKLRR